MTVSQEILEEVERAQERPMPVILEICDGELRRFGEAKPEPEPLSLLAELWGLFRG